MRLQEWRAFYANLGFATVPLVHRGKRPLRRGWLERGDEQWVGTPDSCNIGILTGSRSGGLVVLDFDTRDGPVNVLRMTPEQLSVLTIVVRTSRGWHVYARGVGVETGTPVAGLDLRADGGMVVAPPSVHASGHVYEFVGASRSLVDLAAIAPQFSPSESLKPVAFDERVEAAEAWVGLQAPKLQDAWRRLKSPPSGSFDASRADFAIARCLGEGGWSVEDAAAIPLALPGSRARQRGEAYALRTAQRARAERPPAPR